VKNLAGEEREKQRKEKAERDGEREKEMGERE